MPRKITINEFAQRANSVHSGKYDYSDASYVNSTTKLKILCPTHGSFFQRPDSHIAGRGCKVCGDYTKNAGKQSSLDQFKNKAAVIHDNKYNYSESVYIRTSTHIVIECPTHGLFSMMPYAHLSGQGCRLCGIYRRSQMHTLTTSDFINRSRDVHGCKYDYSLALYEHSKTPITILCLKHGEFKQLPEYHMSGSGCPKCSTSVSNKERLWLAHMEVPDGATTRQVSLWVNGGRVVVDGFNPLTNAVYEFWGDFWHGNPQLHNPVDINIVTKTAFGELFDRTLEKRQVILDAGYNLIEIWEHDWDKINERNI